MDVKVFPFLLLTLCPLPSDQQAGWTSLSESKIDGRYQDRKEDQPNLSTSSRDSNNKDGWTSLLEFSKKSHRDGRLDDRNKKTEESAAEGKQFGFGFGGIGLPSFLPLKPGYYNLGQIHNKIPNSEEITKDVFNLPHGIPDIQDLNSNNYHELINHPFLGNRRPTKPPPPPTTTATTTTTTTAATITTTTRRRRPTRRVPHNLRPSNDFSENFENDLSGHGGLQSFTDIELPETDEDKRFETPFSRPADTVDTNAYQLTIPKDVSGRLKSLEEIFSSLHVKSDGCRKRFVCHLAKDPEKFSPLSHLVLDLLDLETAEVRGGRRGSSGEDTAIYLDILQAVEAGRHRMCYKYSTICQYKGEDMINQDGLRAWKLMYKVLTMKALAVKNGKIF